MNINRNPSGAIKDEPVNKVDNIDQDINSPLNRKRLDEAGSHKPSTFILNS